MDRNSVIGLLLIGAIVIGFSIMNQPTPEEREALERKRDSLQQVEKEREEVITEQLEQVEKKKEVEKREIQKIDTSQLKEIAGVFAGNMLGTEEFYTLENDLLEMKISSKGGRPYSVRLKDYQTHDSLPLILFSGDSTVFNFIIATQQNRVIRSQDLYFKPVDTNNISLFASGNNETLALRVEVGEGKYIEYLYTIKPDNYMIDFRLNMNNMDEIVGSRGGTLTLEWELYAPQQEMGKTNENNYTSLYYKYYQDDVEDMGLRSRKDEDNRSIPNDLKWIAFKDQFFSSVLISGENYAGADVGYVKMPEEDKYLRKFYAEIGVPFDGGNSSIDMNFYFGPNHYKTLSKYKGLELNELVELGGNIIRVINKYVIIEIFNFLQKFISNYGIIILILTVVIKMALLPLTYKSYQSQAKMRVLKPQIDAINAKIPKEKAMERQQETMKLYRKVGINPMGGCLPMLLQMPILFAMFRFFPTSIELRQEGFLWAHDLSTYDSILNWDSFIPFVDNSFGTHLSLFTLLMTVTTILSMNMSTQAASSQQMPGMKGMMYIMPIVFMFALNNFSSGLTYYYFLANLITLGQNQFFKLLIDEKALLKKLEARKAKPKKASGFQARLEKMAKERGYNVPKKR